MSENPRARKVADRIKVIVAETVERRIKDPRLGFVTITDVRVTGDLQHASVFYTVLGSDEERQGSAMALESAKGVIRREVGQGVGIRLTPSIEFVADAMPDTSKHLEDLLRQTAERDAELAALAASRTFAGDADPYRKPVDADVEAAPELTTADGVDVAPHTGEPHHGAHRAADGTDTGSEAPGS